MCTLDTITGVIMNVAFCGHSNVFIDEKEKSHLLYILEQILKINPICTFYLGGYGNFDQLCLEMLTRLKCKYPNLTTIFVTPYIHKGYAKLEFAKKRYDYTLYPPLEHVPLRYCISKRNMWMVDNAEMLIAYVKYRMGGAYKMLNYAQSKHLNIINIANLDML